MASDLLHIDNLTVTVGGTIPLLNSITLSVKKGEVHVLMGPNGAGKSTLGNVLMGHPGYEIQQGSIHFDGQDITHLETEKRARLGLFFSFQNPEEIPGITLENFLRTSKSSITGVEENVFIFNLALKKIMKDLDMDPLYANRHLNVGFSGGEKKKSEILQLLALNPRLAILDETDSGLDVDAVRVVSQGIKQFHNPENSLLIITHNTKILQSIQADHVHVLVKGSLVASGDTSLIRRIEEEGYAPFLGQGGS
ncbi:Fe-S cluster assembly ATPase SufC [Sphaerochaeta sp. PS]|uniref:Fe-S cluster assembly ATPase SufC n=1 Tax=Sphaerochaeta sp. PS TaxID=3076336 RepID=UPI0028A4F6A2|nr:Fe-S cluster assembly ATPase SufC [Sphaerochaeta sp. PS]MDT4763238.1 Fe-S cluster assembly ATPase SufC [Sphaerochaeta sp. PS]